MAHVGGTSRVDGSLSSVDWGGGADRVIGNVVDDVVVAALLCEGEHGRQSALYLLSSSSSSYRSSV